MTTLVQIQRHLGVDADGKLGPRTLAAIGQALGIAAAAVAFERQAFLARYVNRHAPALVLADMSAAAAQLGVSLAHIQMIRTVESKGRSFDQSGRPVILFEPHVFHKRTGGAFSPSSFSYAQWKAQPYPATLDGRWGQLADAAVCDEQAALESASWGMFQIMGFHWQALGYASAQAFADAMVRGEAEQLDAMVRFVLKNGLQPALAACKPGDADSCRAFAKGYNGSGYEVNAYHRQLTKALK